jgi:hypothetical protein
MDTEEQHGSERMACMPNLIDVDQQLSQLVSMQDGSMRKEAEGLEGVMSEVLGRAEQVCSGWGSLAEDGIGFGGMGAQEGEDRSSPLVLLQAPPLEDGRIVGQHSPRSETGRLDGPLVEEGSRPEDQGDNDAVADGQLFGPHSPRTQLGRYDGPLVEDDSEHEGQGGDGTVAGGANDPLGCFLVNFSRPMEQALLSPPPPQSPKGIEPVLQEVQREGEDKGKRSVRLAAKPNAGRSTMEKVQLVLLKKSGMLEEDAIPQVADLKRYRKCYSKPLPPEFIEAVTSLIESNAGGKGKASGSGLIAV